MGKEKPGFLTPKAIANRIKSKGLQKLRWYCQMCQKQCRDENGFKCHTMSEAHQRQLLLFADNSHKFMDEFSREFHKEYLMTLKRRFGTKRVHSNVVYQEYINDRNHVHMNATRWLTLTDYVKWLGRQGICTVDETEKGWFVTYIDRDPETLRRQEEIDKKKKLDLDDRQRQQIFLEKQMERVKNESANNAEVKPTELIRNEDSLLKINFLKSKPSTTDEEQTETEPSTSKQASAESTASSSTSSKVASVFAMPSTSAKSSFKSPASVSSSVSTSSSSSSSSSKGSSDLKRKSTLDEIIEMDEKKREKQNRKDYWLHQNIVVKINTKKLGEKYMKKKAIVEEVIDKYTGVVRLIDSDSTKIKLDQAHLETVLPALGKQVLVLNGAYRGEQATLDSIDEKNFCATITITQGPFKGRVVSNVQYDDISKIYKE